MKIDRTTTGISERKTVAGTCAPPATRRNGRFVREFVVSLAVSRRRTILASR